MPFAGLGLHILLALLCAIHAIRTGQSHHWLFILFAFPLLGSVAYFFAVYLPNSRLERRAVKAVSAAVRAIDPGKEVRAARAELAETPSAQNRMRLASALVDVGEAAEAAELYEGILTGPFAADPELRFGAARSFVECGRYFDALAHLEALRASQPGFRAESVSLLIARSLGGAGRHVEARALFEQAVQQFGTFTARAEYAIWALGMNDEATGARLKAEIERITARWNAANRELNEPVLRRLKAAQVLADARGR